MTNAKTNWFARLARRALVARRKNDERGATLVEYALILGLVGIVAIGALTLLGGTTANTINKAAGGLAGNEIACNTNGNNSCGQPGEAPVTGPAGTYVSLTLPGVTVSNTTGITCTVDNVSPTPYSLFGLIQTVGVTLYGSQCEVGSIPGALPGIYQVTVTMTEYTGTGCEAGGLPSATCGTVKFSQTTVVTIDIPKENQTINFNNPGNENLAASPVHVTVFASSGLAVTLDSTTGSVCTVSGTTITLLIDGSCTIEANQAGNSTYNAAPQVTQTFTVAALNQTIHFNNPGTKNLAASPVNSNATATSGLPVTLTSTTGSVCSTSGTSIILLTDGSCTIEANQAGNGSWNAAPQVTQTFTVAALNQTINFNIGNQGLGASPVNSNATATSGLTVTLTSTTPAVCTVSGLSIILVTTGTCTIDANQAGNASWNAAPQVARTFTVTKSNQTITFNVSSPQGLVQSPVASGATASSGLTVTLTTTTPAVCTISGLSIILVTTGTCTIDANQAGNASYSAAAQVVRSFTVAAKANQTITFNNPLVEALANSPYSSGATASSGETVTLTTTTPAVCTISGLNINLLEAGVCTVDANAPAFTGWNAAPQVVVSFLVY